MNPYDLKLLEAEYESARQRWTALRDASEYAKTMERDAYRVMCAKQQSLMDMRQGRLF